MANINSDSLYILTDHAVSAYNEGKPSADRITTAQIITNGTTITFHELLGTLNNLKFNDGHATRIILNDANEAYLDHDFGINVQTSTKMKIGYIGLKAGDTYKRDQEDYKTVNADGDYYEIVSINDSNIALVKRDWVKIAPHTFSTIAPTYSPLVIEIWNANPSNVSNKYDPISDYLAMQGDKLLHKKSTVDPAVDKAETANQYHIRLLNDFDKTFPNGINGAHIIHKLYDTQIITNYEPIVNDISEYYDSAGISDGHNQDGSTKYLPYVIKNVGANAETFELHLNHLHGDRTYNKAAAMLHALFAQSGYQHVHSFYIVRANGYKHLTSAFVNAKHGTVWDFNLGLPDWDLAANETITFLERHIDPNLIYVAMQMAYSAAEIVATGYITPLLQKSIIVITGEDTKDQLTRIELEIVLEFLTIRGMLLLCRLLLSVLWLFCLR